MKLLFVSPFPYGPNAAHGGAAVAWAQLDALRRDHVVSLICFEQIGPLALDALSDPAGFFKQNSVEYRGVPLRIGRWNRRLARLRAWFTSRPIEAELRRSRRMTEALRATISAFDPDAIVIQFPQMAQFVESCRPVPTFMDVQDALSVSAFRSIATAESSRITFERAVEWLRWVRYERLYYPMFRLVLTLTEQDRYGLTAYAPQLRAVSIGVPVPVPPSAVSQLKSHTIRFVGNFQHSPNRDAVRYFITRVWPAVSANVPDAVFEVAGAKPPPELIAIGGPGVTFVGYITDLPEFLAEAGVVVIPLVSGGGIKIKTLEALAAGAAVVSTCIGIEGIGGEDGKHYLVRDDPRAMAECIVELLMQPQATDRMREQARALIASEWSPEAWAARFTNLIARNLAESHVGLQHTTSDLD